MSPAGNRLFSRPSDRIAYVIVGAYLLLHFPLVLRPDFGEFLFLYLFPGLVLFLPLATGPTWVLVQCFGRLGPFSVLANLAFAAILAACWLCSIVKWVHVTGGV